MRFRNLAFLVVAAIVVSLVYDAVLLNTIAAKASQSKVKLALNFAAFDFLPALALSLFFFCVCAEGLGQIEGSARAKAAMVSSSLMVLYIGGSILHLGLYVLALWTTHDLRLDCSLVASRLFYLICNSFWVAFLIAFATKREMAASRAIPRLAGVLAVLTLFAAVWTSVQLYNHHDPLGLALRNCTVFLFGSATQMLFFVQVWKRWKPDLPIHSNVVS
jgi:hypothetical protein